MASKLTGKMVTVSELGNPEGMRVRDDYMWEGKIGEYHLSNGLTVLLTWLPMINKQTHVNIQAWDENNRTWEIKDICRLQAAQESEALFVGLES
jgi:hypothetical protein